MIKNTTIKISEHQHQKTVIEWARLNQNNRPCLKWLYATPNTAKRSYSLAARMKSEGMTKGILDLCLPYPSNGFHGLYIEMKVKGNKPTPEQLEFKQYLLENGYLANVCFSCDEAISLLKEYLNLK